MIQRVRNIRENLNVLDWKDKFKHGISLLGGELYYITDEEIQNEFLLLVDDIIEKVLKNGYENVHYSTVTNGLYDTTFLFKIIDKIRDAVGIGHVDFNVSYDLKYRFKSEEDRLRCLQTIREFHERYKYRVGVQMILTQHVIDACMNGSFSIDKFEKEDAPGSILTFLYPHKLAPGLDPLPDFFFTRSSFLEFVSWLEDNYPEHYQNFKFSVINSSKFKYTGLKDKSVGNTTQQAVLSDDKNVYTDCGHSVLYRCYSDSDECMLCDLEEFV